MSRRNRALAPGRANPKNTPLVFRKTPLTPGLAVHPYLSICIHPSHQFYPTSAPLLVYPPLTPDFVVSRRIARKCIHPSHQAHPTSTPHTRSCHPSELHPSNLQVQITPLTPGLAVFLPKKTYHHRAHPTSTPLVYPPLTPGLAVHPYLSIPIARKCIHPSDRVYPTSIPLVYPPLTPVFVVRRIARK